MNEYVAMGIVIVGASVGFLLLSSTDTYKLDKAREAEHGKYYVGGARLSEEIINSIKEIERASKRGLRSLRNAMSAKTTYYYSFKYAIMRVLRSAYALFRGDMYRL